MKSTDRLFSVAPAFSLKKLNNILRIQIENDCFPNFDRMNMVLLSLPLGFPNTCPPKKTVNNSINFCDS